MKPYDLIVIGSGPGGQRAAIQGAKAGRRVAVIEKHSAIGGVCINTGTIPSKTMRFAEFEGQYIVIATGTKPAANRKVPINGRNIIDSDQILRMPQIPVGAVSSWYRRRQPRPY
jgi:pyruvate/2-oxoglutarate dehydrogenase complex dihydrolipoamide dehydrogenase (E3) component